jgi:outer membrane lipoprotein-sorting protein
MCKFKSKFKEMNRERMKILLILLTIGLGASSPQKKDPDQILDEVKKTFNQVQDYVVDVNIKVDVDFIKVPETQATIYYKQPDKVHLESKSFAMLPREGLDLSPIGLLKEKYTAIYEKEDTVGGNKTDVVKVIPLGDESNVVLTTLWIDEGRHFIRKVQSTLKIGGTFSIELKYDNSKMNYPLPSSMIFTFNIERLNLPKGMAGELNKNKSNDEKKTTGKVYITYSNYKVNKGIPDSVFEEKK